MTGGSGVGNSGSGCGYVNNLCTVAPGQPVPPDVTTTITEVQQPDGGWKTAATNCAATPGVAGPPPVTADAVREQVVRLVPAVAVGVAPAAGPTLVNMQTIFWSPTAVDRELGPVMVLGQSVAIRIHFDHAVYVFGDGGSATVRAPGTAYTAGACSTAQCPGFDGHTYVVAGAATASSTVTWSATFSVAGGPVQPIPGTVDGPTTTHPLTVIAGRSILVR